MSEINSQEDATVKETSTMQAAVVNLAPEEQPGKPVKYEDLIQKLQQLEKLIMADAEDDDFEALKQKVAEIETKVLKLATKKALNKKIDEITEQPKQAKQPKNQESEDEQTQTAGPQNANARRLVAVDEIRPEDIEQEDWFKDLLKAHKKLVGFRG